MPKRRQATYWPRPAVDVQGLVVYVATKDSTTTGRAEQTAELDDGLIRHGRAAPVEDMHGVMRADLASGDRKSLSRLKPGWASKYSAMPCASVCVVSADSKRCLIAATMAMRKRLRA